MKKITLQKLTIQNFKGITNRTFDMGGMNFTLSGENRTGKTSTADAYFWLLYGKDTSDRKDFSIKPLDAFNNPVHKVTTMVEAELNVNGEIITLRREYSEKWTTKRGSAISELTGHDTNFFYNDVPLKAGEYDAKIEAIMPSKLAKLITAPNYFCTMPWKDARSILIEMAGDVTSPLQKKYGKLVAKLAGKTLEEFKKELAAKKKKIKDEQESIPARIDELKRANNVDIDFDQLEKDLHAASEAMAVVEKAINDNAEANREISADIKKRLDVINGLEADMAAAKSKADREANQEVELLKTELQKAKNERFRNADGAKFAKEQMETIRQQIESTEKDMASLRSQYAKREADVLTIDPKSYCCPTCKREFEEEMKQGTIEEMTKNFNNAKLADLDKIRQAGLKLKEQNESRNQDLHELSAKVEAYEQQLPLIDSKIKELEENITNTKVEPDYSLALKIEEQIKDLRKTMPDTVDASPEAKDLVAKYRTEIDAIKKQLSQKDVIAKNESRIQELTEQESTLAQALADLEKEEFQADNYVKGQMEAVTEKVNGLFTLVKWKMFETQINGGETPTCVALRDGVPYQDVNTADRINMGLDIINALSKHYGISAPIWIDNRESVNQLIYTEAQVINLFVSQLKELTVIS